jgi:hypothetical protein
MPKQLKCILDSPGISSKKPTHYDFRLSPLSFDLLKVINHKPLLSSQRTSREIFTPRTFFPTQKFAHHTLSLLRKGREVAQLTVNMQGQKSATPRQFENSSASPRFAGVDLCYNASWPEPGAEMPASTAIRHPNSRTHHTLAYIKGKKFKQ